MIWIAIYATVISSLLLWRSEYKLYKMNKKIKHVENSNDIRIDAVGDKLHEYITKEKFARLFGYENQSYLFEYLDHVYSYSQLLELYNQRYGNISPDLVTRIDISKYTQKGTK
ncbi:hypothetical protein [Leuconostoc pseudomesenteroides]|uniref:hypothetical protein n=1 Tax=Leuconostoc pseudomesenteroides TaxID=33968 RepID=UPI0011247EB2|nr:hypothetical protein [Leuconostoc pseudomesenteroides]TOZ06278.1 hypothetical protein DIS14_05395 [Leuconostoc pseudomesenteroides]